MDRSKLLVELRNCLEAAAWQYGEQLEAMLAGLVHVRHFDLNDPSAVATAVHSAIPSISLSVGDDVLESARVETGPGNKLTGSVIVGGVRRTVSIELHYAGPRGGTRKSQHQFADVEADTPSFPGFELEAPADLLLFLAYYLGPTKVRVERLFLAYADGVDKQSIELHRPVASTATPEKTSEDFGGAAVAAAATKGATVKAKQSRQGDKRDAGTPDKRRDGSTGS